MGQSASIDNKCLLVPVLILVNSFNGERISGCRKRVVTMVKDFLTTVLLKA